VFTLQSASGVPVVVSLWLFNVTFTNVVGGGDVGLEQAASAAKARRVPAAVWRRAGPARSRRVIVGFSTVGDAVDEHTASARRCANLSRR
jgi:hypothetical protein